MPDILCQTICVRNLTATVYLTYFEYYLSDFSYEKPIKYKDLSDFSYEKPIKYKEMKC
jgi:hypothetical protein